MDNIFYFHQYAMTTLFEGWLIGKDPDHSRSVANLLKQEIIRVEQLLSRYDPAAELARINRDAAKKTVKIERELMDILDASINWYSATHGYFDVGVNSKSKTSLSKSLQLNYENSAIRFLNPNLSIDMGGYGKGYALDQMGLILKEYGIESAFLHGGKSSFLALGERAKEKPWLAQIGTEEMIVKGGLSYSAMHSKQKVVSDIIDPHTSQSVTESFDCAVWASDATSAEVYSTAIIAMGKSKALDFCKHLPNSVRVQFIQSFVS